MRKLSLTCSLLALALAACGGNSHSGSPDAALAVDAAAAVDAPVAPIDGAVPTWHLNQPVVSNAGGAVLAAPKVVPIFFTGDAAKPQIEAFLTQLAASSYWPAISAEYGVGALTIAPSVVATETPPTTDAALQAIIGAHAGGTGGWPASDANTIYTVFLPSGVTLSTGSGTSCVQFAGYHDEASGVVYALMPWCATGGSFTGLDQVTIATAHELLEASTDPHPRSAPAFAQTDDAHAVWQFLPGAELGDMCEMAHSAYQPLVGTYMVQRMWSNASAAAGHDPCVPVLATPYVVAEANVPDLSIDFGGGPPLVTPGLRLAVGASQTIEVDLYADGSTPDFTVEAIDTAQKYQMASPELSFAWDRTTGNSGDKLHLTVTRVKAGAQFGASELGLFAKVNGVTIGVWWLLVM
jgi:hypothetical protein